MSFDDTLILTAENYFFIIYIYIYAYKGKMVKRDPPLCRPNRGGGGTTVAGAPTCPNLLET